MNIVELYDIEAIKRLKARYFRFVDAKRFDDLLDVFADDGVFDLENICERDPVSGLVVTPGLADCFPGTGRAVVNGNVAIVDFIRFMLTPVISVHHGYTPEIEIVSSTEATGIWRMDDFFFEPQEPFRKLRHGHGHYHETYRKNGDQWKILRSELVFQHEERF